MKAILVDANQRLSWRDVPEPVMAPGQVMVDIHAAALNRADLLQRAGKYPPPPGWPEWMGLEMAGIVAAVGPEAGHRWNVGDRVCGLLGGGGYAERIAVEPGLLMPVPENVSMEEAAAIPEVFATAYLNLYIEGGLKAGDTVFIPAGASGLGIAAIQMAKLFGAKVLTTVSSTAKAEAVRRVGADVVINRTTDDIGKVMDEHPVDIVMDCVGGALLGANIGKLAAGGRWILIATLGGEHADIPLRPVLKQGLRLIGSTLRSRAPDVKRRILAELTAAVLPRIADGSIRILIHRTFPIVQAEAAHAVLERQENIGKVVLIVRPGRSP